MLLSYSNGDVGRYNGSMFKNWDFAIIGDKGAGGRGQNGKTPLPGSLFRHGVTIPAGGLFVNL